jgi:hypothetical protein
VPSGCSAGQIIAAAFNVSNATLQHVNMPVNVADAVVEEAVVAMVVVVVVIVIIIIIIII